MIERQFITQKLKEFEIQEYIASKLAKTGYSHTEIKRTPLGEKVVIYTTRPGLVVGRKGENIQKLTNTLKKKFKMENPQIEIGEVENPLLNINFVCDKIISTLERFGSQRFKSIGYKTLQDIMDAGAIGAEIVISGKVPSARARSWRFAAGYLKKSGDIAESKIKKTYGITKLKPGVVGVRVSIMTPDIKLPDDIKIHSPKEKVQEEKLEEKKETKVVAEISAIDSVGHMPEDEGVKKLPIAEGLLEQPDIPKETKTEPKHKKKKLEPKKEKVKKGDKEKKDVDSKEK